jgi:glycerol-3-phosphate dehydrogenase
MTCVGTTDLDHSAPLSEEPRCTAQEADYLIEAIGGQFPQAAITGADVVSSMAGVRPVIASGKGLNPSQESREHSVWRHDGMVCVAGGKLTTFRLIALDALRAADLIDQQELVAARATAEPQFRSPVKFPYRLGHPTAALPDGEALIETLAWALDNEMVARLDDLLLRRVRVGNTRPAGARDLLPQIRALCQSRLGWDDARWAGEAARYLEIIARAYSPPGAGGTP